MGKRDVALARTVVYGAMSKYKLGNKEFDVDAEIISAGGLRVSDADCAVLAALMRAGEVNNVKKLLLVSHFFAFISALVVRFISFCFFP
jgi:hypothetical protein